MIPKITINLQTGGLGAVASSVDSVAGLVIGCDPGSSGIVAGTMFALRSVGDAITANIHKIDFAYQQVKEFYAEAGAGVLLYVSIVGNTETFTQMADIAGTNKYAKKLLDYAQGKITLLGICRKPAGGYSATTTNAIDADCDAAIVKMQALAVAYAALFTPFVGFVECKYYTGVAASLTNYAAASNNYVAGVLSASKELYAIDANGSSVGLAMGRAAKIPVQRKLARVKDGALLITGAYLGATATESADYTSVDAKGFIVIGKYANITGYYFMDDILTTLPTDDYKTVSLRRTMNKMVRIVYATYINELNDDIQLTSAGLLSPATVKYYKGLIENAVNTSMTGNGELSSFSAYLEPSQNVLSSSKVYIRCAAVPKGYSQEIVVTLGFSNPQLS